MRSEHAWLDDAPQSGTPSLTRRGVLAQSLKLAGAGALALTLTNVAARSSLVLAQDDSTPEAGVEGEVEGGIQVGTTDDAAAVEGEAAAGAELPADDATTDDQTREERRAAREGEEGVGAAVGTVPNTGVGAAIGSSLGGVMGAIGLAAASVGAAIYTRRGASQPESGEA